MHKYIKCPLWSLQKISWETRGFRHRLCPALWGTPGDMWSVLRAVEDGTRARSSRPLPTCLLSGDRTWRREVTASASPFSLPEPWRLREQRAAEGAGPAGGLGSACWVRGLRLPTSVFWSHPSSPLTTGTGPCPSFPHPPSRRQKLLSAIAVLPKSTDSFKVCIFKVHMKICKWK